VLNSPVPNVYCARVRATVLRYHPSIRILLEVTMWYDGTKNELDTIVEWLQSSDEESDLWKDHIDLGD
jgi:hypothetical protein